MSPRILLALAVLVLDLWAIERVWRPGSPLRGRLRWSAAIVLVPVVGALLAFRGHAPAISGDSRPIDVEPSIDG